MQEQTQYYINKLNFEIDAWDLNLALQAKENIVVIDARSPAAYELEHIPGALNLPHREMNDNAIQSIDRNALIITYCDGIGCNASTKGALNMTKLGFKVKELMGGLDWWKRDGYPTAGNQGAAGNSEISCGC